MTDTDFTINDYANSSYPHGNNSKRIKNAKKKNTLIEERKNSRSKKKQLKIEEDNQDDNTKNYPLDLWFLLSEYIKPELVGKFACICKSSYHIVKTAKFWFYIYKKYYKEIKNIPQRLTPGCMTRPYGLRACAIRSLHFTYFSSFDKVGNNPNLEQQQPHSLVNRQCCLMWNKKGETRWYYYFKLKLPMKQKKMPFIETTDDDDCCNRDLHEMIKDVWTNTEENCKILRVACSKFSLIPLVNGLILQKVKLDLSPSFDYRRLQLTFGTNLLSTTSSQVVILSGVADCKVLDWWHPYYPHQDTALTILEPVPDSWDVDDIMMNFELFNVSQNNCST